MSNFMYGGMFAGGQKASVISTNPGTRTLRRPTGAYEELLCEDCEGKLGVWETYASGLLDGGEEMLSQRVSNGFKFQGINYNFLKLFQLSLLWRFAVSQQEEFKRVTLDENQCEHLRLMLWNDNPGNPCDYGCYMFAVPRAEERVDMPEILDGNQYKTCRFMTRDILWNFFIPSAPPKAEQERLVVTRSGELFMPRNDRRAGEFFRSLDQEYRDSGNLPECPL